MDCITVDRPSEARRGPHLAPLRWLGIARIVGIFLFAPALVIRTFVAGQRRVGNTDLAMMRGVQRNEVALMVGSWVMMCAALAMACPRIERDIAVERRANAVATDSTPTPADVAAAMSAPPPFVPDRTVAVMSLALSETHEESSGVILPFPLVSVT